MASVLILTLIGALAAGCGGAAEPPTAAERFVAAARDAVPDRYASMSDDEVAEQGAALCNALDGLAPRSAVDLAIAVDLVAGDDEALREDVATVYGIAIGTLCPRYAALLE